MVKYTSNDLDRIFSALSDPTRRAILQRLSHGEATVTELAKPFDMSLPAISRHLRVLEEAGLLLREREGRIHRCSFNAERVKAAADWLERYSAFWKSRLNALESYLGSDPGGASKEKS
jgi:DNA-binding transcriptional ArsR family regulator